MFGDIVAVCDPNLKAAEGFAEVIKARTGKAVQIYQDYRKMLERKDLEIVTNATPEHWHAQVMVDAVLSGRDVFTEKPLCVTIHEAKTMRKVVQESSRIVQVGSQQRSRIEFEIAVKHVHEGRIGNLKRVYAITPFHTTKGGPFEAKPVPSYLDWDIWQGPAAARPFMEERIKYFRGFQEYGGGILTDWGQHQLDVAFWGMKMDESGPLSVEGKCILPNPEGEAYYNNPDRFLAKLQFPGNLELLFFSAHDKEYDTVIGKEANDFTTAEGVAPDDTKKNGIMFIGEKGRVFVNRGGLFGLGEQEEKRVKDLMAKDDGNGKHMKNFFDCVKSRQQPICPLGTATRVITACLLSNIAIRHGRKIQWDVEKEEIVGDAEAKSSVYMQREERAPYQLKG